MQLRIPADALAFERRFGTEISCRRALLRARFPFGFRCPRCGARPHLELPRLFRIVYLVVAEKDGTNALAISRQLGVSYPTALLWMRKVRAVMAKRKREKLRGPVEVDETIVGGGDEEARGRRLGEKRVYVVILAEDKGMDGMGRIRRLAKG